MARPPGDEPLDGALVCLHGRGGNHRFAFDDVYVHDVVASAGLRVGVAAVDGGENSYWHQRRDGTDAGRMVLDDFVPLVRDRMGTERLAIMGWSMGGFGALLLAQQSPSTFEAVVASSPALWQHAGDTAPGAFDGAGDFAAHDLFAHHDGLDPRHVRIDCGTEDPFASNAGAFVRSLGPLTASTFSAGYHDALFWRWIAPREVAFVGDRLGA
jgi:pimeloyl-ACP methyl ester carboxylesterase